MGDSESGFRERSTSIQEEEEYNIHQSTSLFMTSEVEGQLLSINVVTSYDGCGNDTPTVTSSGSY